MTSRKSSGSSCVDSAVEPTRSQNITVIWRRSAAFAARATGGADIGEETAGEGGAAPPSFAPHCAQNREAAALAWPQAAQLKACAVPHCGQNLLSPGMSLWQLGQVLVVVIGWCQLLPDHIAPRRCCGRRTQAKESRGRLSQ